MLKRLFFNKEMLPCGYIACTVNDNLKFTFLVKQDDQNVPFAQFSFIVRESGLESLDLPLNIPLKTWNAREIALPVNFSKNSTYQKKYQNTIANALQDLNDVLLQAVRLELEMRQSDFIVMASKKNFLQASTINIRIDRASIVDSMMAQDLTENA